MIEADQYRRAAPLLDRYNTYLLRKTFAAIRVAGLEHLRTDDGMIAAANHSAWWDGCVALHLSRTVLQRRTWLMMGETQLRRHKVFSAMGVFGVPDDGETSPAASLRYIIRSMRREAGLLWLFPQGVMLPARAPLRIRPGAEFLLRAVDAPVAPVALRYEFRRSDHPEVLVRIGTPIVAADLTTASLAAAMESTLARLDSDLAADDSSDYERVLAGRLSRDEFLDRVLRRESPNR